MWIKILSRIGAALLCYGTHLRSSKPRPRARETAQIRSLTV
jgi:hypothetical protein